jgi:NCS1 family nucleobase:cation symporter-1
MAIGSTGQPGVSSVIEAHSIDYIPEAERHGKPYRLFFVWWSSNMQMTTVLTGVLAAVFGLSFPWALVAIVAGTALGGLVMALHSAQGPILGIPQMIQSRAQFGFIGAVVPVAVAVIMYVGFFAASNLLGGQAINATAPGVPLSAGIVICAVLTTVLAVFGYDHIHRWAQIFGWIFLVSFLALTVSLWARGLVPADVWRFGHFVTGPFLLMLATAAIWIISYAVYVSDYSRYLPTRVRTSQTFWYTYWGGALSSAWLLAFGALLGVIVPRAVSDTTAVTLDLAGPVKIPLMVVIAAGVIFVDALNAYGASLCLLTITEQGRRVLGMGRPARVGTLIAIGLAGALLGIFGSGHFLTAYSDFLFLLLYFLIPWSAINLVDFYLVSRGHYDLRSFFDPRGRYGGVRTWAVICYVVGFGVEIPFMNTTLYEGPLAKAMGGGDVSWIFGLIVAGGLYAVGARTGLVRTHAQFQAATAVTPAPPGSQ